jgi:hypothetical protein
MKILKNLFNTKFIAGFALILAIGLTSAGSAIINDTTQVGALSGSEFNPGRIIDDAVFYNESAMDPGSIQNFLNIKVSSCDTNGSQRATEYGRSDITRAQYAASKGWQGPPYTCLKDYRQNTPQMEAASGLCNALSSRTNRSGAEIIYDIARACHINPQVLIILLQKEQSLILDTWPLNSQYTKATGFACPDTAPCDPGYGSFFYQVYYAARQFQVYKKNPLSYNYVAGRNNTIYYNPGPFNNSTQRYYGAFGDRRDLGYCGSSQVYIENQATAALYIYTPYQPNNSALTNLYGSGDICGSYGNRNFWRLFSDWFGSTRAFIKDGVSYSDVFNAEYYLTKYPDVRSTYGNEPLNAFKHFVDHGMREGRQGSVGFDVNSYRNRHQDLRLRFGADLTSYYVHYLTNGKAEGRIATGAFPIEYITKFNGIEYSSVYNFSSYISFYADMQQKFYNDDAGAIRHFISQGASEGRQGNTEFSLNSYRSMYFDLRRAFGGDFKAYYMHYITNGKAEGRIATGTYIGGITSMNGIDYSTVYNFNDYSTVNPDIKNTFGLNDVAALHHFVNYGMSEGRQANTASFNVHAYRNRHPDLQNVFGNNLKAYYMHYLTNGKAEGRSGI